MTGINSPSPEPRSRPPDERQISSSWMRPPPALAPSRFDVVLCCHLLWALPDPAWALRRWAGLLAPGGQLVLVEGYWHTGGGLHAEEIVHALPPSLANAQVHNLTGRPNLWGGDVGDERYAIVALSGA